MKKHIIINGKVQNVGFRYWLYKAAIRRKINGWVKNKISGEVEALLVGKEKEVNSIIKLCEKGPSTSNVTKISVKNYKKEYLKNESTLITTTSKPHLKENCRSILSIWHKKAKKYPNEIQT